MSFRFILGEKVGLSLSEESGFIVGRAEYLASESMYQVRYVAADARQVEGWFNESALVKV